METLGKVNNREIKYFNIRSNPNWFYQLPSEYWIAFTIADIEDQELLNDATIKCLDKGVLYTCSAGQLASETEDYFIQEIAWRETQKEESTGIPADFDKTPSSSFGRNFSEEFWFSTTLANPTINDEYLKVETVACIDFTSKGVKEYIRKLIIKINGGWLPSDEKIENPQYDS